MKNPSSTIPTGGCKTALSNNWFELHADYLFNFAIGQMRNIGVAEDLV